MPIEHAARSAPLLRSQESRQRGSDTTDATDAQGTSQSLRLTDCVAVTAGAPETEGAALMREADVLAAELISSSADQVRVRELALAIVVEKFRLSLMHGHTGDLLQARRYRELRELEGCITQSTRRLLALAEAHRRELEATAKPSVTVVHAAWGAR